MEMSCSGGCLHIGKGQTDTLMYFPDFNIKIGSNVIIDGKITLYHSTTIGSGVRLGNNVVIRHGSTIGDGCKIADNTLIYDGVTIAINVILKGGVIIDNGVTIMKRTIIDSSRISENSIIEEYVHVISTIINERVIIGNRSCIYPDAHIHNDVIIPEYSRIYGDISEWHNDHSPIFIIDGPIMIWEYSSKPMLIAFKTAINKRGGIIASIDEWKEKYCDVADDIFDSRYMQDRFRMHMSNMLLMQKTKEKLILKAFEAKDYDYTRRD